LGILAVPLAVSIAPWIRAIADSSPTSRIYASSAKSKSLEGCQEKKTTPRKSPSALKVAPGLAAGIQALHSNTSYVLSAILWLSTFGVSLERRTTVGKALSAPLATMALALTMANIGLLPFQSPVCKFLGSKYVRLL
jgi:hypothetical protein